MTSSPCPWGSVHSSQSPDLIWREKNIGYQTTINSRVLTRRPGSGSGRLETDKEPVFSFTCHHIPNDINCPKAQSPGPILSDRQVLRILFSRKGWNERRGASPQMTWRYCCGCRMTAESQLCRVMLVMLKETPAAGTNVHICSCMWSALVMNMDKHSDGKNEAFYSSVWVEDVQPSDQLSTISRD